MKNQGLKGGTRRGSRGVVRSSACQNYQPEASSPLCRNCNGWQREHGQLTQKAAK